MKTPEYPQQQLTVKEGTQKQLVYQLHPNEWFFFFFFNPEPLGDRYVFYTQN